MVTVAMISNAPSILTIFSLPARNMATMKNANPKNATMTDQNAMSDMRVALLFIKILGMAIRAATIGIISRNIAKDFFVIHTHLRSFTPVILSQIGNKDESA